MSPTKVLLRRVGWPGILGGHCWTQYQHARVSHMAAGLLSGASKFGARAELLGPKRERLTIPAAVCLFGTSTNDEQPKTFLESIALAGCKMISPECPRGTLLPAGTESSHAGLSPAGEGAHPRESNHSPGWGQRGCLGGFVLPSS